VVLKNWGESYDQTSSTLHVQELNSSTGSPLGPSTSIQVTLHDAPLLISALPPTTPSGASEHPLYFVALYAGVGISMAVMTTLSRIANYVGALRASRLLFDKLLDSVFGATMRWYDVTPTGRILNRFSRDIEVLDTSVADSAWGTTVAICTFTFSVLFIATMLPGW
jgi:ABC-type multidrug transport system fused ATPase/permease subunit